jgi:hypothetical protein
MPCDPEELEDMILEYDDETRRMAAQRLADQGEDPDHWQYPFFMRRECKRYLSEMRRPEPQRTPKP